MSRPLNKLTPRRVAALNQPGRWSDGGGLYLRITKGGARTWIFMATIDGKRAEISLGPEKSIPLATARKLATAMREAVALGTDPRQVLVSEKPPTPPEVITFGQFADSYITDVQDGWKNPVHRQQWRNSLRDHAKLIKDIPIADISTEHVLAVVQPIWGKMPETANRVRGRIEKILNAAKARGLRRLDSSNPAQLRGHLDVLLPKRSKLTRGHHAALPHSEAPAFMTALRKRPALAARCLEFTILTAARSGEALGADWGEIDLNAALWTVPAERMKAGEKHVVPLSTASVALLESMAPSGERKGRIFAVSGAIRSNMAMSMLLRRMGYVRSKEGDTSITVHGFRSTFRDWAGDETDHAREVIEACLAHAIGNATEKAYRRGDALEKRRKVMADWAEYLASHKSDK